MSRGRPKGIPKTGGRKKGTPNKTTASIREALRAAFDEIGGIPALVKWGKSEPTEFYRIWSRLLPTEVELSGKDGSPIPVTLIQIVESTHADVSTGTDPGSESSAK